MGTYGAGSIPATPAWKYGTCFCFDNNIKWMAYKNERLKLIGNDDVDVVDDANNAAGASRSKKLMRHDHIGCDI